MRTMKDAEARKHEILDVAEALFVAKGYDNTTIGDMLAVMGIARGTLYYHYRSKEEVLDGIIARRGEVGVAAAQAIADDEAMSVWEKLLRIMLAQKPGDAQQAQLVTALEDAGNAQMFQKSLTEMVLHLAPVLGRVIAQGNAEGTLRAAFPLESAEVLLAAAHALFDNGALRRTPEEMQAKTVAFLAIAERVLGVAEGALMQMMALFAGG